MPGLFENTPERIASRRQAAETKRRLAQLARQDQSTRQTLTDTSPLNTQARQRLIQILIIEGNCLRFCQGNCEGSGPNNCFFELRSGHQI